MVDHPYIDALYRYPVKGLSPERLTNTPLSLGMAIEHDRAFAIEAGTSRFDQDAPEFLSKTNFLMLMRDEALAALTTQYDADSQTLCVKKESETVLRACLDEAQGRAHAEAFFAAYMPKNSKDPSQGLAPKIVRPRSRASGFTFSDLNEKVISIVNLASVEAIAEAAGVSVDPLRFRANIYLKGLAPWAEMEWVDQVFRVGSAELAGAKLTRRCNAINVDPKTGQRDLTLTKLLPARFGHSDCGIYMRVTSSGLIGEGDQVAAIG